MIIDLHKLFLYILKLSFELNVNMMNERAYEMKRVWAPTMLSSNIRF